MSTVDERLKACRDRYQRFTLKEHTDHREHAFLCFSDDLTFGHLRSGIGKVLLSLMSRPNVEFEPIGETAKLREIIERAGKPGDAIVKVNIDVYGPRSSARGVGKTLSDAKLWLQQPDTSHPGIEYHNPHLLSIRIRGSEAEIVQPSQPVMSNAAARKQTREEQLRKMVEEVYRTVGSNRDVDRAEGGSRVTRELLEYFTSVDRIMQHADKLAVTKRKLWASCWRESLATSLKSTAFGERSCTLTEASSQFGSLNALGKTDAPI